MFKRYLVLPFAALALIAQSNVLRAAVNVDEKSHSLQGDPDDAAAIRAFKAKDWRAGREEWRGLNAAIEASRAGNEATSKW